VLAHVIDPRLALRLKLATPQSTSAGAPSFSRYDKATRLIHMPNAENPGCVIRCGPLHPAHHNFPGNQKSAHFRAALTRGCSDLDFEKNFLACYT